jgi:hypothetical protein
MHVFDDFREAYSWLRHNTPEDAKVPHSASIDCKHSPPNTAHPPPALQWFAMIR